jgi:hypothetical protein
MVVVHTIRAKTTDQQLDSVKHVGASRESIPGRPSKAQRARATLDHMTDVRETGLQVFRELLPGAVPDGDVSLRDGKIHLQIARTNGLTEDELAEVIYHASGYAGFPAANTARKIAREVFDEQS